MFFFEKRTKILSSICSTFDSQQTDESLFASFSTEKEDSLLLYATRKKFPNPLASHG
jgi:hypothetical protein